MTGPWTKVKQVAAYSLGLIKRGGIEELLEKVRVIQSGTLSLIQGGFTGGSTTSESSCETVRICCNVLVEKLTALTEQLMEHMGTLEWETLILQAYQTSVTLSASTLFISESPSVQYLNYGATIEGAYVQGFGFFMFEEYPTNSHGLVTENGTWSYKDPTLDTIPKQFNVEILNSEHHQKRVLSSKASGEPLLTLAVLVHSAMRAAIAEATRQLGSWNRVDESNSRAFQLEVPAVMPVVKKRCGLDSVQKFLQWTMGTK
ncbi:aldehyde oxidase 4-like [Hibiscus syriacus]|uniref:aldehyde oxidase 4-like n=1 Tax=Hibiscus syriacus TaxID=106335 RepID=UPI00192408F6|nr:aldehyde oxidase 4-like [Hibiscus syriacus]